MKKKFAQLAFFNQPVLIGLFVVLAGVFLALLGSATFSNAVAQGKGKGQPQLPRAQFPADARTAGRTGISHTQQKGTAPTGGSLLWYNGDFEGEATGNGLTNEENTFATGFSHIYDDFIVTDSGGWDITSVFSNDFLSSNITSATWEIRQGLSSGNGGTLVASGSTDSPVITPTGRFGFGFTEFTVEVTGLSVHLAPGTYWLNVTPVDNLDGGRGFDTTTLGANCVGTPCANDDNAFLDSTLFGANFEPTTDFCSNCVDFSMGLSGTVSGGTPTPTPTPGQLVLKLNSQRGNDRVLVRLRWTGANTPSVKIFRNGALLATVENTGSYTDTLTAPGIYTYQVCEKVMGGTGNCSNEKSVRGP